MDFHHLYTPQPANNGAWVVLAKKDMFLILLRNGTLAYGPDHRPKEYHFTEEVDAHIAAADYYSNNKRTAYPYTDRLLELSNSKTFFGDEKSQSQPMIFK